MRTLKGNEALKVAEEYGIYLYDVQYRSEVTAEQAQAFIDSDRNPNSFVIQNWPDTDDEAEKIVMREFEKALREQHLSEARILDLFTGSNLSLHAQAAELAADRLVERGKLEVIETHKDGDVYGVAKCVGFHDEFLDKLHGVMCDACAELDFDGPFHEICLLNLMDFLQTYQFTPNDIVEMHEEKHAEGPISKIIRPGIGMGWLSKTASATKLKWKSVIRPVLGYDEDDEETDQDVLEATRAWHATEAQTEESEITQPETSQTVNVDAPKPVTPMETGRKRVSKDELIQYLQSIEILDDISEIQHLHEQRDELIAHISEQERENERILKQKQYAEKQILEIQRDMDILIQAMQITKRRGQDSPQVVEATYESE